MGYQFRSQAALPRQGDKELGPREGKGLVKFTKLVTGRAEIILGCRVSFSPAQCLPGLCKFRYFHKFTLKFLCFFGAWQWPCLCASLNLAVWLKSFQINSSSTANVALVHQVNLSIWEASWKRRLNTDVLWRI